MACRRLGVARRLVVGCAAIFCLKVFAGLGFVRTRGAVLGLVVGVYAGLLLSALVVCESRIFSLSLLATVRGGTSFLCPKRQRNEAKKALLNHATLSVHSVQF